MICPDTCRQITFIPTIIIVSLELKTLQCILSGSTNICRCVADQLIEDGAPVVPGQAGCFLHHASKIIFIAYILLIMCESSK